MSKSYSSCPPWRLHGGKTLFLHLKNYYRERNSKIVESILRKPVEAINNSHRFSFAHHHLAVMKIIYNLYAFICTYIYICCIIQQVWSGKEL
jgi:hypothetical protein